MSETFVDIGILTHVLAGLNGTTLVFLVAGYLFIRQGRKSAHKVCMSSALVVIVAFFIVYIVYHANAGLAKFGGSGLAHTIYLTLLAAHISVAVSIPVLAPMTAYRAFRKRHEKHKRLARWTWPLWTFSSVSGLVVYFMAVHLYPFQG